MWQKSISSITGKLSWRWVSFLTFTSSTANSPFCDCLLWARPPGLVLSSGGSVTQFIKYCNTLPLAYLSFLKKLRIRLFLQLHKYSHIVKLEWDRIYKRIYCLMHENPCLSVSFGEGVCYYLFMGERHLKIEEIIHDLSFSSDHLNDIT